MISYLKLATFLLFLLILIPHLVPIFVVIVGRHPQGMGWGVRNGWPGGQQSLSIEEGFF